MPHNKSHHFVPQFLLKHFAADDRRRHVCLFRVGPRRHHQHVPIKHQCARDYMYGKGLEVERGLAALEHEAARVIRGIVNGAATPEPYSDEMATMLLFTAFQWTRTPVATSRTVAFMTQFMQGVLRSNPKIPRELRRHIKDVEARADEPVAPAFYTAGRDWQYLSDLDLKILVNKTRTEFAIGDAPVVFHNQWCRRVKAFGSIGYVCSGLQVVLPLSPIHLALFYDSDVYAVGSPQFAFADATSEDEVRTLNALQFAAAEHAVYYRTAAMAAALDAIPTSVRDNRLGVTSARFGADPEPGGKRSTLVQVSNVPLNVDLAPGAIRMRLEAAMVPVQERIQKYRPIAKALQDEHQNERGRRAPPQRDQRFTRIDDEDE